MVKRLLLTTVFLLSLTLSLFAQRTTDKLDRGLVAVPGSSGGTLVSWRIFGEEYYDTEYNIYRNGTKLNDAPLKVSNFTDVSGSSQNQYQVAAVVRGVEQEKSKAVSRWNSGYLEFAVKPLYSRRGTNITNSYEVNDIALADVDGDGVAEFLVKRNYSPDKMSVSNDSAYNHIECYNIKGERLWYIDLGPNMVSGPDEQYDAVGYDWDGDGKAEVLMRGADNMIIHCSDGSTVNVGSMTVNTRNTVNQSDGNLAYTNTGNEYLLYIEGATGKPYPIGPSGALWMSYPLPRGSASDWGDGYGHRSTKHYFGAPFLDGRHPFIFLGRGCYTKHHMKAFSVNPTTHALSLYWEWSSGGSGVYFGQGFHNFGIADVDWDGRDEIVFGSMVIDDNGKGLSSTGLGHGDAQHCSDFDPYRHGQEIFTCNEDRPAMNYRDATTSKIYYRLQSTADDGRAICGNFSDLYPGCIGHSSQSGVVSTVADKVISGAPSGFAMNFRIYWDGDLLEEALDGASSREGASRVFKADGTTVFTANGTANCNWTKNTPSATGDIIGDWREEIIARTTDNKYIRVYTTNIYTPWRNYSLWHDHQYRQGMVWESVGYNQPPHASYFLGELENITVAPPPLTMTNRTEIGNNGTISAEQNDQHIIVCETNNTEIKVADGASPHIATFNVPSWIQGTNSASTTNPVIKKTYYECNVTGGSFAGDMRLVKQGDGILNLPKVNMLYTGPTDIWAGVVNFDGTMKNSVVWLNRFAELNSDGGEFKALKLDYDSRLRPGRADNQGTVSADSIGLGFGSRIVFDIYNDGLKADLIKSGKLSIEKKNWNYGPKYLTPVFEFVTHFDNQEGVAEGRYFIGEIGQVIGDLSDIKIEGIINTKKSVLVYEDGKLYLEVKGMRDAASVVWKGTESNIWDLGISKNFTMTDGEVTESQAFVSGDKVLFDDSADSYNVLINGEVEADSIIVDNTKAYSFSGSGSITGQTTLVKRGEGVLTIRTDNSYKGGTRISGGAISVSSLSNSTQALGNLGSVNTIASKMIIENGAELRTTAAVTQGSAMSVLGDEGGVINNSNDYAVAAAISGTNLMKKGSGWMKLNVNNTSLNRLIINGGTVQCVSCNTPAKTVEFRNGTLSENTGTGYSIDVAANGKGTWNLVNDANYSNKITGKGTLTISCPVRSGGSGANTWYATRTRISGNWSDFEGTIVAKSNGDPGGRFTLDNGYGMPKGTFEIPSGVEVQNSAKTYRIGKLTGSGNLGGVCSFSSSGTSGSNTWEVGNDESWSWSGRVTGSGTTFVKVGSGKMTVRGVWNNTGSVRINEGELCIFSGSMLGSGSLVVAEGASLTGVTASSGFLTNAGFTINGTVQVGVTRMSYTGVINFGNKNVTFNKGSNYIAGVIRAASSYSSGCTSMNQINRLIMNGKISVFLSPSYTPQEGDSIRLWEATSFSGNPEFDLPELENGLAWDTSRISEGLLFVVLPSAINNHYFGEGRSPEDVFTLDGQLVRKNAQSLEGLPRGIYLWRGRKTIVK